MLQGFLVCVVSDLVANTLQSRLQDIAGGMASSPVLLMLLWPRCLALTGHRLLARSVEGLQLLSSEVVAPEEEQINIALCAFRVLAERPRAQPLDPCSSDTFLLGTLDTPNMKSIETPLKQGSVCVKGHMPGLWLCDVGLVLFVGIVL